MSSIRLESGGLRKVVSATRPINIITEEPAPWWEVILECGCKKSVPHHDGLTVKDLTQPRPCQCFAWIDGDGDRSFVCKSPPMEMVIKLDLDSEPQVFIGKLEPTPPKIVTPAPGPRNSSST